MLVNPKCPAGMVACPTPYGPSALALSCHCQAMVEARSWWLPVEAWTSVQTDQPGGEKIITSRMCLVCIWEEPVRISSYCFLVLSACSRSRGPQTFSCSQFYHHSYRNQQLPRDTYCSLSLGEISLNSANLPSPFCVPNLLLGSV